MLMFHAYDACQTASALRPFVWMPDMVERDEAPASIFRLAACVCRRLFFSLQRACFTSDFH